MLNATLIKVEYDSDVHFLICLESLELNVEWTSEELIATFRSKL